MKKLLLAMVLYLTYTPAINADCLLQKDWYDSKDISYFSKGLMQEKPKYIILHHTKGDTLESVKPVFEEHGTSCHYIIDLDGAIHKIINDSCIAYHAGYSYWQNDEQLNKNSIGIEVLNTNPYEKDFNEKQYKAIIKLVKQLMNKYDIDKNHVLAHGDIAYFGSSEKAKALSLINISNRKQDPNHLFQWDKLAENGIGIWYDKSKIDFSENYIDFYFGDQKTELLDIKLKLKEIGYKIDINENFDIELYMVSIMFHRHFYAESLFWAGQGLWSKNSTLILNEIIKNLKN